VQLSRFEEQEESNQSMQWFFPCKGRERKKRFSMYQTVHGPEFVAGHA
jgi:hypothetical protein